jgi:hypothetical protein
LATNDHISSSWISWVSGGKSHVLVVGVSGVLAGQAGQPHDGVAMDPDEAFGLTDAVAFDQMLEDGDHFFRGEAGVGQWRPLAFGESGPAGVAVEQTDLLMSAVAVADREIADVSLAVERAFGVLATEAREVVHG